MANSPPLPPRPDFEAIERAASASTRDSEEVYRLLGNLTVAWSNNESLLIYVIMVLLQVEVVSATIVFATLNTTRARLTLIERLTAAKVRDPQLTKDLRQLGKRFGDLTKVRNDFTHCMYSFGPDGHLSHTQAMRLEEARGQIRFGATRPLDARRLSDMRASLTELVQLNRWIWELLPRLQAELQRTSPGAPSPSA